MNQLKATRVLALVVVAVGLLVLSCDEGIVYVDGIQITEPTTTTYFVGDSVDIRVAVSPPDATLPTVTWTCDPADIVSMEETTDGARVTALAPGTVTITVTSADGTTSTSLVLTIKAVAATSVAIDESDPAPHTVIGVGGSETLSATVSPANATDSTVTWTSSNTSVATVDSASGKVTGVATGTTTITVKTTDGGFTDTVDMTVMSVDLTSAGPVAFNPGEEQRIELAIEPANAGLEYVVSVDDAAVAHVVGELLLPEVFRLVGLAAGTATVTVASADNPSVSDTVAITVGADTVAPKLEEFAFRVDDDTIQLQFSELMNAASVENTSIYDVSVASSAATVLAARVVTPENPWYGTQVQLDLASAPGDGVLVSVEVTGGTDAAGNAINTGADTWEWVTTGGFGSIDGAKVSVAADGTVSLEAGAVTTQAGYSSYMVFGIVPAAPDTNSYVLTMNMVAGDGSVASLTPFPSNYSGNQTVNENFQMDLLKTDGNGNAVFRNGTYGIGFAATHDGTGKTVFAVAEGATFTVSTGW